MSASTRFTVSILIIILCVGTLCTTHVTAFTAQSLEITINNNGDATAIFQYSLDGVIENAIPDSMLKEELRKGLSTSSDPPTVIAFNRSGATLLLRNFAQLTDAGTGTEYVTASMDFNKAEIALKNSALSYVISADFSPQTSKVIFPDGYIFEFSNLSTLPSVRHIVSNTINQDGGAKNLTMSSVAISTIPDHARVFIDSRYTGETPGTFSDIEPGLHTIAIKKEGYETVTEIITTEAGTTATLSLILLIITPTPLSGSPLPFTIPGFGAVITILALAGVIGLIISLNNR